MSSKRRDNRDLLISLTKEINRIHEEMKIIRDDIQCIRQHIEDAKPIVIDKEGDEVEEPVRSWFWS